MRKQQQENNMYTFQITIETEQVLEQTVFITTNEEHPSAATLERLAQRGFDDHVWERRDTSPNIRVVGVKQIEYKKSGLSTDKCYYQLEFHPLDHTESFVLLPGKSWRRSFGEYHRTAEELVIAEIVHQYPDAIRIYSTQMAEKQKRRQEEYQEKQTLCLHANASILLYEKRQTIYTLRAGKIVEFEEDFEPTPLWEVEMSCPDCHLSITYPDWRHAPEPIQVYSRLCFHHCE